MGTAMGVLEGRKLGFFPEGEEVGFCWDGLTVLTTVGAGDGFSVGFDLDGLFVGIAVGAVDGFRVTV